jgi:ubiquinone/menaquinone biosynthesis C-methylase UbiE
MSNKEIHFLEERRVTLDDFEAAGLILDIGGGGEGVIGQLKGDQVVAIDPNRRELEEAPLGPIKVVMDARDLQFLDDAFETATAFFTLMYLHNRDDHEGLFRETFRVLKPGGRFLIWDAAIPTCLDPDKEIVAFYLEVELPDRAISTGYGTRWPAEDLNLTYYITLAESAGFAIKSQEDWGTHFFLELYKPEDLE